MAAGISNVSFALLDDAVIRGRADEPLLRTEQRDWSHARLLEEVAAIGGVLGHLGVLPGTTVLLDLGSDHDLEAVVAALATARVGGVVATGAGEAAVVVCSVGSGARTSGDVPRLVRGTADQPVTEPDLDWSTMLRAGRTDPAGPEVLHPGAAYSSERDVAEQTALLADLSPPFTPGELRALLQA
jgi:hypothetical protein